MKDTWSTARKSGAQPGPSSRNRPGLAPASQPGHMSEASQEEQGPLIPTAEGRCVSKARVAELGQIQLNSPVLCAKSVFLIYAQKLFVSCSFDMAVDN